MPRIHKQFQVTHFFFRSSERFSSFIYVQKIPFLCEGLWVNSKISFTEQEIRNRNEIATFLSWLTGAEFKFTGYMLLFYFVIQFHSRTQNLNVMCHYDTSCMKSDQCSGKNFTEVNLIKILGFEQKLYRKEAFSSIV
jgi:hypothetical protein